MEFDPKMIEKIKRSSFPVILSGAGLSAESGISTFRDPGGLWDDEHKPEDLATMKAFRNKPKVVLDWYNWRRAIALKASPNMAHRLIARWQERFPALVNITQNVDGLLARAGVTAVEMHGSIHRMKCIAKNHDSLWVSGDDPRCEFCNSPLRPDIVWFGESISKPNLRAIDKALLQTDLLISIGTSGVVYPAAGYIERVGDRGVTTICINNDPYARGAAEYFLLGKASEVMTHLSQEILIIP